MSKLSYTAKKKFLQTEKKLEKKHYQIVIGLMIFAVAYYYLIQPKTIGHDERYALYIFWLPTIMGMIALGIYRRQLLLIRFSLNKGFVLRAFMIGYYFIGGAVFSYLSFGQASKMAWDYLQYETVRQNNIETLSCPITRFLNGKDARIDFLFNDRHESFKVTRSTIKDYANKNVGDYYLKVKATKGVWNYYTVNEWSIKRK